MTNTCLRIAMWSGPRNISTTLMRSFGARLDTAVADEPLYAHYLLATGIDHPGRQEVIARHETDWRKVAAWLTGPVPGGKRVFYQKHMSKHLLPGVGREWLNGLTHAFLIRDPAEMLASFARVVAEPALADTGLPEQVELFEQVADRLGRAPPVVDARDVLTDPPGVLSRLCAELGLDYTDAMLTWPAGRRDTDGTWAPHWYAAVEQSTGFGPPPPRVESLPAALERVLDECRPHYERLAAFRLRAGESR
jgi:hypothetical protein